VQSACCRVASMHTRRSPARLLFQLKTDAASQELPLTLSLSFSLPSPALSPNRRLPLPWSRELKLGRRRVLVLHPFSAQAKRRRRIRLDLLHRRALLAVPSSALALLRLQAPAMAASMPGAHGRAAARCCRPSPGQGMAAAGHVQGRRFSSAVSGHRLAGFSTP